MIKAILFLKRKWLFLILIFLFLFKPSQGFCFNFSLSLNPYSGEIFPGEKFQTALSLNLLTEKSAKVSLKISKIPQNIKVKFSPSSCEPPCSSILKITSSKKILSGNYFLEILATGKGVTRTTTFNLRVLSPPKFDFSLDLSHSREEIWPGQTTFVIANLKYLSGTPERVSLATSIIPRKIKVKFSPPSCKPPCSSTIEISCSKKTPTGEYLFSILAIGEGITKTADFKLTILSDLNSPILLSPKNRSKVTSLTLPFDWIDVVGAKLYIFEVDSYKIKTKKSFLVIPQGVLKYNKSYVWRVKACEDEKLINCSSWSDSFKFETITKKRLAEERREKLRKELQKKIIAILRKIISLMEQLREMEKAKH